MAHETGTTIKPLVKIGRDPADCWQWLGKETPQGYGIKSVAGKDVTAARWLWSMLFGELPAALRVIHTCGNSSCVNPAHMRAGSQADACRSGIGATLTPADVREIRQAAKDRGLHTARGLAQRFGVTDRHIRDIWRGRTWGRAKSTTAKQAKTT